MLENFLLVALLGGIATWTMTQSIREILKTRKNKRPYQNESTHKSDPTQPLLGVVFPQDTNQTKDK